MKRAFWFAVTAGVTVFVALKVRDYLSSADPDSLGGRVHTSITTAEQLARDFADRVRAAMAEREAEIRDTLGLPQ